MSILKALERLRRIRCLEEEQRRLTLETAVARLQLFKQARDSADKMERQGRARVTASAVSGELTDRVAGWVETESGRQRAQMLQPRIAAAEVEAVEQRREFLEKRVARRQAATLIEEAEARNELDAERRSQRSIDEWFGARLHRKIENEERGEE
jgi:hypothetical protein